MSDSKRFYFSDLCFADKGVLKVACKMVINNDCSLNYLSSLLSLILDDIKDETVETL